MEKVPDFPQSSLVDIFSNFLCIHLSKYMKQPLGKIIFKHSEEVFCLFNIFLEPLETLQQYSGKDMLICNVLEISRGFIFITLLVYFIYAINLGFIEDTSRATSQSSSVVPPGDLL